MAFGATWAFLSISKKLLIYWDFPHITTTISKVYREWSKNNIQRWEFSGWKSLFFYVRSQWRNAWLLQADRKTILSQVVSHYNQGCAFGEEHLCMHMQKTELGAVSAGQELRKQFSRAQQKTGKMWPGRMNLNLWWDIGMVGSEFGLNIRMCLVLV